jgi:hypothetical protein
MLEETGLEAWIAERNEEYGRFSVRVLSNSVRNDIWKICQMHSCYDRVRFKCILELFSQHKDKYRRSAEKRFK